MVTLFAALSAVVFLVISSRFTFTYLLLFPPGKINTSSSASFSPPAPQTPKTQLMSSSIVLRMADFSIYQVQSCSRLFFCRKSLRLYTFSQLPLIFIFQVSTADQRRSSPKTMISCNKKSLYLPSEMPAIHVEFTEYYFPDGKDYPSKTFVP